MADESWFERLEGTTRGRVLTLVRREPRTVSALADALDVTHNAVRGHLSALERDGLVERVAVERDTGGKPARVYGLTEEAEELFPKAYARILGALLTVVRTEEGQAVERRLLADVARRLAGAAGREGANLEDRVQSAAAVLGELGGEAEVERVGGGFRIQGHGCPYSGVVAAHPELCGMTRELIGELTGGEVEERCDRSGRPRCAFEVRAFEEV